MPPRRESIGERSSILNDRWTQSDEQDFLWKVAKKRPRDEFLRWIEGYCEGLDMRHFDFQGRPINESGLQNVRSKVVDLIQYRVS